MMKVVCTRGKSREGVNRSETTHSTHHTAWKWYKDGYGDDGDGGTHGQSYYSSSILKPGFYTILE